MGFDLAMVPNSDGIYDFVVEGGSFKEIDSFDTSLLITVFCERRANQSEEPVNYLQRGWWGNELNDNPGIEIGSKQWLLSQSRNTQKTLNYGVRYQQEAFQWFVDMKLAAKVTVDGNQNLDLMNLSVNIYIDKNIVSQVGYQYWLNTGQNASTVEGNTQLTINRMII